MDENRSFLCIGGPLDGQLYAHEGEYLEVVEHLKISSFESMQCLTPTIPTFSKSRYRREGIGGYSKTYTVWLHEMMTPDDMIVGLLRTYIHHSELKGELTEHER